MTQGIKRIKYPYDRMILGENSMFVLKAVASTSV